LLRLRDWLAQRRWRRKRHRLHRLRLLRGLRHLILRSRWQLL
jgi:hypothetical protein